MIRIELLVGEYPDFLTRRFEFYLAGLAMLGYRRLIVAYDLWTFPYRTDVNEALELGFRWARSGHGGVTLASDEDVKHAFFVGNDLSLRQVRRRLERL